MLKRGNGQVLVGFPVFNTGVGSRCEPWWVRLPSIPAFLLKFLLLKIPSLSCSAGMIG